MNAPQRILQPSDVATMAGCPISGAVSSRQMWEATTLNTRLLLSGCRTFAALLFLPLRWDIYSLFKVFIELHRGVATMAIPASSARSISLSRSKSSVLSASSERQLAPARIIVSTVLMPITGTSKRMS